MIMIIYGSSSSSSSSSTNSQLSSDPCSDIYCILYIIWVFRKIGVPQIIHFNRDFHYKPSILGYHYFWKHPYYNQCWQSYIHIVLASFCGSSQHQTAQLTKNQPPIQAKRALAWQPLQKPAELSGLTPNIHNLYKNDNVHLYFWRSPLVIRSKH